jgi:hypothetical protein
MARGLNMTLYATLIELHWSPEYGTADATRGFSGRKDGYMRCFRYSLNTKASIGTRLPMILLTDRSLGHDGKQSFKLEIQYEVERR